jgi:WhiB family redox-sensing transcriptional regulator
MSTAPNFRFAPCATVDPEAMFPLPTDEDGVAAAKRICGDCDFRAQCLEWALSPTTRANEGVFGGASENERRRMKRGRKVPYRIGPMPSKQQRHAIDA